MTPSESGAIRRLLLFLVLIGEVGLLAELALLEHVESAWQWTPVVILALSVPATAACCLKAAPASLRLLRVIGGAMVAAGLLGLYLHYRGNVEFELESDGSLRGWTLFWSAMKGATPTLSPGALAQLGLAALLAAYRHPARSRPILNHSTPGHS